MRLPKILLRQALNADILKSRCQKRFFLIFFTCLLVTSYLWPDTLSKAQELSLSGDNAQAVALYEQWIRENPGQDDTASVLLHAASLVEDPRKSLALMLKHVEKLQKDDRPMLYERIAGLELTLGFFENSAEHWQKAASYGGPLKSQRLIKAYSVRFVLGENVRNDVLELIRASEPKVREEAVLIAALELTRNAEYSKAIGELERFVANNDVSSAMLYHFIRLLRTAGRAGESQEILEQLKKTYAGSTHLYVLQSKIFEWISPVILLLYPVQRSMRTLQIGAFAQHDRALKLRENVEDDGFTAWIEEGNGLWKVIINDSDGRSASRLLEKGYGALLNP